jgi:hypothetical protein
MSALRSSRPATVLLLIALWPAVGFAQSPTPTGVITGLQGRASVTRPVVTQPIPLKFRDDLFLRDQVETEEHSLVRALFGGKALVTIRELSTFTITEEPNRSAVDLKSGKLAVGVAKSLLKPGEAIEVRTPNAISAVRGSLLIVSVTTVGGAVQSTFTALDVDPARPITVSPRAGGASVVLGANQAVGVRGTGANTIVGPVQNISPDTARKEAETAQGPRGDDENLASPMAADISRANFQQAIALATVLAGGGDPQLLQQPGSTLTAASQTAVTSLPPQPSTANLGVNARANDKAISNSTPSPGVTPGLGSPTPGLGSPTPGPGSPTPGPGSPTPGSLIVNGGFETGSFSGWSLTGQGSVVTGLGSIAPPEGKFMGLLHTVGGAIDPTERFTDSSKITQSFAVTTGALYVIKATYNFLSNEFPTQESIFNDAFEGRIKDPAGQSTLLALESRNTSFSPSTVSPETATAGGFTIEKGNGVTGFKNLTKSWVPTTSGQATLSFEVGDVFDMSVQSAVLVDGVSVLQDPPLYFVGPGDVLTSTLRGAFVELTNQRQSLDSLLVVCCQGKAMLAGPLLRATNSDLTVPFSLLSVLQGGSLITFSTDPLAFFQGGTYTFGSTGLAMFDLSGVKTALDAETGLIVGTDQPLQHRGSLLEADGASVQATKVVQIDTALLEATAPLLSLRGGSTLTTARDAVDLSYRAQVSSIGPLVKLDASTLTVHGGSLVNVNASKLTVGGDLVTLLNGATLTVSNGPLITVGANSFVTINGALINFTGTGGSKVNMLNNLCPCSLFGGVPVALQNGAQATNVHVTNPVKNAGELGQLNLSPTAALAVVNGAGSKLTVSGR